MRYDEVSRLAQRLRNVPARRQRLARLGVDVDRVLAGRASAEEERLVRRWFDDEDDPELERQTRRR
jgi:hypothetical protein